MTDTERLDFLERYRTGYGGGVICRQSTSGRGFRLHETSAAHYGEVFPTVREAIDATAAALALLTAPATPTENVARALNEASIDRTGENR